MNIGIDVDGVLTDIQSFNLKHAPPFFKAKFNRDVADIAANDICDVFGCGEDERYAYWKKYLLRNVILESARKDAKKIIRKLHADGHTIFIITKRVFTCQDDFMGKLMRFLLRNWLCRNGIKYHEIVFCDNDIADSKRTACIEKQIDIMIDDEPININAIAPIAKAICYDTTYNQDCEGENVFRAQDWDEVYEFINDITANYSL